VKHLEQVPIRTLVLVDRHEKKQDSDGVGPATLAASVLRRLLCVATLALASAQPAWAHATFLRSSPANGRVLDVAPRQVRVLFTDDVRVGPRNAAIQNDGGSILDGRPRVVGGKTLVLPLRKLQDGDYSVRWSIVSDDGHEEEGVLAFAVGTGRSPPVAALGSRGEVTWQRVLSRTLFFLGILGAAGATAFALFVLRPLKLLEALHAPQAHILFFSFLAAFLGSDALIHGGAAEGTRFQHVVEAAAAVAAVGGAAAALAPAYRRLRYVAWSCGCAVLLAPTLSGHALDDDQPRVIAPLADLVHTGAAALWFGGLLSLAFALPRASEDGRNRAVRRFSALALGAVVAIGIAGVVRAVTELSAVHELWSTSYGRAILVKTAIFAPLLALGWLNRVALLSAFARLRRSVLVELTLLAGIAVAVGVLTDLPPGRVAAAAGKPTEVPAAFVPPPLPPRGAFVDARRVGSLAVGLAAGAGQTTVTVIGPDGEGVNGLDVRIDGAGTAPCGVGCYRADTERPSQVSIGSRRVSFAVPAQPTDGSAILRRATQAFRDARTVVFEERLTSAPGSEVISTWRVAAPDRLSYSIRGGSDAIVIGNKRWDRAGPGDAWQPSAQTPLRVPAPSWSPASRNAHVVAPNTITFFDPQVPAWFRLRVDPATSRPREMRMVAAAHFMTERYSRFDRPLSISPPSR
jgi:copper transport protein